MPEENLIATLEQSLRQTRDAQIRLNEEKAKVKKKIEELKKAKQRIKAEIDALEKSAKQIEKTLTDLLKTISNK